LERIVPKTGIDVSDGIGPLTIEIANKSTRREWTHFNTMWRATSCIVRDLYLKKESDAA
jgi:hypothetical protein